jgi:hypothetical protein
MSRFRSIGIVAAAVLVTLALGAGCGTPEEKTMNASAEAASADDPCSWVAAGGLPVVADL